MSRRPGKALAGLGPVEREPRHQSTGKTTKVSRSPPPGQAFCGRTPPGFPAAHLCRARSAPRKPLLAQRRRRPAALANSIRARGSGGLEVGEPSREGPGPPNAPNGLGAFPGGRERRAESGPGLWNTRPPSPRAVEPRGLEAFHVWKSKPGRIRLFPRFCLSRE